MMPVLNKKKEFGKGKSREAIISDLVELLKGKVLACFLFGSFATKTTHVDSDLDLIIVKESDKSFLERSSDFLFLMNYPIHIDYFVYTPKEFNLLFGAEDSEQKSLFHKRVSKELLKII